MLKPSSTRNLTLGDQKTMLDFLVMPLTPRASMVASYHLEQASKREITIQQFQNMFIYGISMKLWRKQTVKSVYVYIDQVNQNLLWVSTKTKAFLLDLTYTTIHRFDMILEYKCPTSCYVLLRYFEEQYPFLFFEGKQQAQKVQKIFEAYINYVKVKNAYPAYFSRIYRLYTMSDVSYQTPYQTTKDILQASKAVGLINSGQSMQVLRAVYQSQHLGKQLRNDSVFNRALTIDYFKIMYCEVKLQGIFQHYHPCTFKTKLQYLKPQMSIKQFQKFLVQTQKEHQNIVTQILAEIKNNLSFYDFCAFLEDQKINYAARIQNMDQHLPLNQYYCYSSHNTYLSGNQLTSDSKVDRYIEDLLNGLKCVELDVHNKATQPVITHAFKDKGFSKEIPFESVIAEVTRFSYTHQNHYPIILSIENHANESNCLKMFDILTKNLEGKIVIPLDQPQYYKLSELKGKIIIKTHSELGSIGPLLPAMLQQLNKKICKGANKQLVVDGSYSHLIREIPVSPMTKLTAIYKSAQGIKNVDSTSRQCCSMTNVKVLKCKEQNIIDYCCRSWLRTYPMGTQFTSGNYNPAEMLKVGAQIIALNTQTKDDYAWMMMNYFKVGQEMCPSVIGYIPKPIHLRKKQNYIPKTIKYTVTVISRDHYNVTLRFLGTQIDQQNNQNSQGIFIVQNHLEGFIMFEINQGKWKDCIPLRFTLPGYRVIVGKNQTFADQGVRVMCKIDIQSLN